ncbi:hypothetical protein [Flavobacterium soyae]|uniref:Addiction module component n=1 Tax=Flavobacterium soyae TaxID=2903098 RepID=A0ABZ2UD50_9FLAO
MEVIRIEFKSEIKERLLEMLSCFSSDELKIIFEDSDFYENKIKVHEAYSKLKNGTTKLYSIDEVELIIR